MAPTAPRSASRTRCGPRGRAGPAQAPGRARRSSAPAAGSPTGRRGGRGRRVQPTDGRPAPAVRAVRLVDRDHAQRATSARTVASIPIQVAPPDQATFTRSPYADPSAVRPDEARGSNWHLSRRSAPVQHRRTDDAPPVVRRPADLRGVVRPAGRWCHPPEPPGRRTSLDSVSTRAARSRRRRPTSAPPPSCRWCRSRDGSPDGAIDAPDSITAPSARKD